MSPIFVAITLEGWISDNLLKTETIISLVRSDLSIDAAYIEVLSYPEVIQRQKEGFNIAFIITTGPRSDNGPCMPLMALSNGNEQPSKFGVPITPGIMQRFGFTNGDGHCYKKDHLSYVAKPNQFNETIMLLQEHHCIEFVHDLVNSIVNNGLQPEVI